MANDCFKICSDNLVEQATITASTENAQFPASNLLDYRRSKVFRSTSNSDNLVFDLQETSDIDTVFIVADKRNGFGVSTVTIEFNSTSNFVSPAFSTSVTFSTQFGIGFVEFAEISYRFARIVMTSTLGYCELSKVFIGKALPLTRGINFGWTIKDEELSQKQFNRYGQQFTDVILRQKSLTMSMNLIDKEDLDLINSFLDDRGETKPFYIILGTSLMVNDNRRFSGPVFLDDIPSITNSYFNKYALSLKVKELT